MTQEPTRKAVLGWLEVHPQLTQGDCITALWGGLADQDLDRVAARVRQWVHRARGPTGARRGRQRSRAPRVLPNVKAEARITRSPDVAAMVAMGRIPFLEHTLDLLLGDVETARETKQLRLVPMLMSRVAETRAALDEARAKESRMGVKLDRSVPAVVAELARQRKAIDILLGAAESQTALAAQLDAASRPIFQLS